MLASGALLLIYVINSVQPLKAAASSSLAALNITKPNDALLTVDDDEFALPPNDEAKLIHRLIRRYKGFGLARPVAQVEKTLNISLFFAINEFLGIDELTGTMKVTATVIAKWQDDLLRWNTDEFNQLKAVPMRTKDVYLPTIIKDGNGGTQSSIFMTGSGQNDRDINSMVWVHHTGLIEAKVIGTYATACKLNLADFPFDQQNCDFTFRAWRFSDKRITLNQASGQERLGEHFSDSLDVNVNVNPHWLMSSVSREERVIPGNGENYSAVCFNVVANRRSDYYVWNVILPSIAMAVLLLATFFMPFGPDRSMFCITLVLTMNIFQQALTSKLPVTAEVIPYVRQTTVQVLLGIFITIESAFVWWLAAKDKRMAVPRWLRSLIPTLRKKMRDEGLMGEKKIQAEAMLKVEKDFKSKAMLEEAEGITLPRVHSRNSISSRIPGIMDAKPHEQTAEEFIVWGEWLEVAQLIDLIMLMLVIGSMCLLPIYFYRHRLN